MFAIAVVYACLLWYSVSTIFLRFISRHDLQPRCTSLPLVIFSPPLIQKAAVADMAAASELTLFEARKATQLQREYSELQMRHLTMQQQLAAAQTDLQGKSEALGQHTARLRELDRVTADLRMQLATGDRAAQSAADESARLAALEHAATRQQLAAEARVSALEQQLSAQMELLRQLQARLAEVQYENITLRESQNPPVSSATP
jgi:hypothetical protein